MAWMSDGGVLTACAPFHQHLVDDEHSLCARCASQSALTVSELACLLLRVAGKTAAAPGTEKGRSKGCPAGAASLPAITPALRLALGGPLPPEASDLPCPLPGCRPGHPGPWLCFWSGSSCPPSTGSGGGQRCAAHWFPVWEAPWKPVAGTSPLVKSYIKGRRRPSIGARGTEWRSVPSGW